MNTKNNFGKSPEAASANKHGAASSTKLARREFLKRGSALSVAGSATPWAVSLAAMGEAAAQSATDYKALVCVFLVGGNDYGNTVIPADTANHSIYSAVRGGLTTAGGLAIPNDAVLASNILVPTTALTGSYAAMKFAIAPYVNAAAAGISKNPLVDVFDAGRLGILFNVGTLRQPTTKAQYQARSVPLPPKLFSHNDQQSFWQSSKAEGAVSGWGGRMGDLFAAGNGKATFTTISVSGNAVYLSGQSAVQYQVSSSGSIPINSIKSNSLFGSAAASSALRSIVTTAPSGAMGREYAAVTNRSIEANEQMTTALATSSSTYLAPYDSTNILMSQLRLVARTIQARNSLGAKRQVFFVSIGGFDTHDTVLTAHPGLMQKVSDALRYFDSVMEEIQVRDKVTTFTASDFGRTLTGNGNGSDHGWGSHHLVMGGAIKGEEFYGKPPILDAVESKKSTGGLDDVGQGRLLPSTSVDQLAATLATWFGVSATDMSTVLPQINNWNAADRNLGFFRS
jgi:uncharacterized protein (DUF1501 family)